MGDSHNFLFDEYADNPNFLCTRTRYSLLHLRRFAILAAIANTGLHHGLRVTVGRNRGGGDATGAYAPPLKKQNYFLCRIIRFYTNNPKCQYVYLSFHLNDYQIIDKVNTI